jgi:hypothetical protein
MKESSDFILNTFSDQLTAIQNNLLSVLSTLPTQKLEQKDKLNFYLDWHNIIQLVNYINQQAGDSQISRNNNSINSLTPIVKIQVDHLRHLELEMANDC